MSRWPRVCDRFVGRNCPPLFFVYYLNAVQAVRYNRRIACQKPWQPSNSKQPSSISNCSSRGFTPRHHFGQLSQLRQGQLRLCTRRSLRARTLIPVEYHAEGAKPGTEVFESDASPLVFPLPLLAPDSGGADRSDPSNLDLAMDMSRRFWSLGRQEKSGQVDLNPE
jgi:hypothetical protein